MPSKSKKNSNKSPRHLKAPHENTKEKIFSKFSTISKTLGSDKLKDFTILDYLKSINESFSKLINFLNNNNIFFSQNVTPSFDKKIFYPQNNTSSTANYISNLPNSYLQPFPYSKLIDSLDNLNKSFRFLHSFSKFIDVFESILKFLSIAWLADPNNFKSLTNISKIILDSINLFASSLKFVYEHLDKFFVGFIIFKLLPVFKIFDSAIQKSISSIFNLSDFFVSKLSNIPNIISNSIKSVSTFVKSIKSAISSGNLFKRSLSILSSSIRKASLNILRHTGSFFYNSLKLTVASISRLLGPLLLISPLFDSFREQFKSVSVNFSNAFSPLLQALSQSSTIIIPALNNIAAAFGRAISSVLPKISQLFNSFFNFLSSLIFKLSPFIEKFIISLVDNLGLFFSKILPSVSKLFDRFLPIFSSFVDDLFPVFIEAINDITPPLIDIITDILPPIVTLLKFILIPTIKTVSFIASNFLLPVFKSLAFVVSNLISAINSAISFFYRSPNKDSLNENYAPNSSDLSSDLINKNSSFDNYVFAPISDSGSFVKSSGLVYVSSGEFIIPSSTPSRPTIPTPTPVPLSPASITPISSIFNNIKFDFNSFYDLFKLPLYFIAGTISSLFSHLFKAIPLFSFSIAPFIKQKLDSIFRNLGINQTIPFDLPPPPSSPSLDFSSFEKLIQFFSKSNNIIFNFIPHPNNNNTSFFDNFLSSILSKSSPNITSFSPSSPSSINTSSTPLNTSSSLSVSSSVPLSNTLNLIFTTETNRQPNVLSYEFDRKNPVFIPNYESLTIRDAVRYVKSLRNKYNLSKSQCGAFGAFQFCSSHPESSFIKWSSDAGLNYSSDLFTLDNQAKIALSMIKERLGPNFLSRLKSGSLTPERFLSIISRIWVSLPGGSEENSLTKSIGRDAFLKAISLDAKSSFSSGGFTGFKPLPFNNIFNLPVFLSSFPQSGLSTNIGRLHGLELINFLPNNILHIAPLNTPHSSSDLGIENLSLGLSFISPSFSDSCSSCNEPLGSFGGDSSFYTKTDPRFSFAPCPPGKYYRAGDRYQGFLITSNYGLRRGRMHYGVDIAAPEGTPLSFGILGVVINNAYESGGFGNYLEIRGIDNFIYRFAHLKTKSHLSPNHIYLPGTTLGLIGNTGRSFGSHLHFERNYIPPDESRQRLNPHDFIDYLGFNNQPPNKTCFNRDNLSLLLSKYSLPPNSKDPNSFSNSTPFLPPNLPDLLNSTQIFSSPPSVKDFFINAVYQASSLIRSLFIPGYSPPSNIIENNSFTTSSLPSPKISQNSSNTSSENPPNTVSNNIPPKSSSTVSIPSKSQNSNTSFLSSTFSLFSSLLSPSSFTRLFRINYYRPSSNSFQFFPSSPSKPNILPSIIKPPSSSFTSPNPLKSSFSSGGFTTFSSSPTSNSSLPSSPPTNNNFFLLNSNSSPSIPPPNSSLYPPLFSYFPSSSHLNQLALFSHLLLFSHV